MTRLFNYHVIFYDACFIIKLLYICVIHIIFSCGFSRCAIVPIDNSIYIEIGRPAASGSHPKKLSIEALDMENRREEDIEFISTELLPEAVHNRCFCEPGSREFVEFVSAVVEPARSARIEDDRTEYYRATLIVNFSGEPRAFELSIKTLRPGDDDAKAYDGILNEEMFYSKIAKGYDLAIYPKCYVADMGRYGRPVIVLEDLEALGYRGLDSKLDEDHLELSLRAIGRFHERGFRLKATNFNSFREFYAKLIDTRLDGRLSSEDLGSEATKR